MGLSTEDANGETTEHQSGHRPSRPRPEGFLAAVGHRNAEVPVGAPRGDAATIGALDQAALQQVRLVDVLDRVARLTHGHGEGPDAHGSAVELVDDKAEVIAVGAVEADVVYALHLERGVGRLLVYLSIADDLGVVAHALEEPVRDPRRASAAAGELRRPILGDRDSEYLRVPHHDFLQLMRRVVVESGREPEAIEQGLGHEPGAGGSANQGEARDVHPDGACRGSLPEDDIHRVVLHRRIEDLLNLPVQAMDLVYKKEIAVIERGEDGRHIPRPLQARPAGGREADAHLRREDAAQARLPEPRWPGKEYVVQCLFALLGCLHEDSQVVLEPLLPDELVEVARPERRLVVFEEGLRVERVLSGGLFLDALPANGEVVHLFHAQRLLPIRRKASLMYLSTLSWGGMLLSAFSASSREYPSPVSASRASM